MLDKIFGIPKPSESFIDPAVNEKASLIVIESVSRYPQAFNSSVFISESLMESFDHPEEKFRHSVTISQMAGINPDPSFCSKKINEIHNRFGIDRVVSEKEAFSVVLLHAIVAIDKIGSQVNLVSNLLKEPIPFELTPPHSILYKDIKNNHSNIRFSDINREYGYVLHDLLVKNETLRDEVKRRISLEASYFRKKSKEHRHYYSSGEYRKGGY